MDILNVTGPLIPVQDNWLTAAVKLVKLELEAAKEAITLKMEEMDEEHGGEGGLLEEAKNEKGKVTKASINVRLKDILTDPDTTDERTILNEYFNLIEQETEAGKKIKDAKKALDAKVIARYNVLSEDAVKTLVVEDKWLTALASDVQSELNRISQSLTGRFNELAERYATPLPRLTAEVEELSSKVEAYLQKMGFVW